MVDGLAEENQGIDGLEEQFLDNFKQELRASITTIGRIVVDVIPNDTLGSLDAEPIYTFEVLGQANNPVSN